MRDKFWQKFALDELNQDEWEALCDGCAQCCLRTLEDEDTGDIAVTDLCCRYLDTDKFVCTDYANRHSVVPDCVPLNAQTAQTFYWLPDTCAYRLRADNQPLPAWHYLESGDRNLVHELGISLKHEGISEDLVDPDCWQERVIRWVEPPNQR